MPLSFTPKNSKDMKRLVLLLSFLVICSSAIGQTTLESRVTDLEKTIADLSAQLSTLSLRLDQLDQQNNRLRKAVDYGKPTVSQVGKSGVEYRLLSLAGDVESGTVTAHLQIVTSAKKASVSVGTSYPPHTIIDLYGNRYVCSKGEVGGEESFLDIYKGIVVKASVTFDDLSPEKLQEAQVLILTPQVGFSIDEIQFKNIKVEWH